MAFQGSAFQNSAFQVGAGGGSGVGHGSDERKKRKKRALPPPPLPSELYRPVEYVAPEFVEPILAPINLPDIEGVDDGIGQMFDQADAASAMLALVVARANAEREKERAAQEEKSAAEAIIALVMAQANAEAEKLTTQKQEEKEAAEAIGALLVTLEA